MKWDRVRTEIEQQVLDWKKKTVYKAIVEAYMQSHGTNLNHCTIFYY